MRCTRDLPTPEPTAHTPNRTRTPRAPAVVHNQLEQETEQGSQLETTGGSSSCHDESGHQGCGSDMPPPPPACFEFSFPCFQSQTSESFPSHFRDISKIQVILNWTHRDIFLSKFTFKPGNL